VPDLGAPVEFAGFPGIVQVVQENELELLYQVSDAYSLEADKRLNVSVRCCKFRVWPQLIDKLNKYKCNRPDCDAHEQHYSQRISDGNLSATTSPTSSKRVAASGSVCCE
jgi:hypothetical protein